MDYWLHIGNLICIFGVLAISLNFVMGFAGLLSLGQAAFFGFGAYGVAILMTKEGWSFWPASLVAMCIALALGALLAVPALRVRDEYLIVLTLAFQFVVSGLLNNLNGLTNGTTGIYGIPHPTILGHRLLQPGDYFPYSVVLLVLVLLLATWLSRSPFGLALRTIREDETAARAVGKNILVLKLEAFAAAAAVAAIAGAWYAGYSSFISPDSFNLDQSIAIVAMVALGGLGNPVGPAVGAGAIILLPEFLRRLSISEQTAAPLREAVYGMALAAAMAFRPTGAIGEGFSLRGRRRAASAQADARTSAPASPAAAGPPALLLTGQGVSKHFGGVRAVDRVEIEVHPGRVLGLVGPNGAGKTTLFNLLAGALRVDEGLIRLGEREITRTPVHRRVSLGVARTFQDVRLFSNLTALQNVAVALPRPFGEHMHQLALIPAVLRDQRARETEARRILGAIGLGHAADVAAHELSYAEQKLLSLARLLATRARVLLLDEPGSGLDEHSARLLYDEVRRQGEAGCTVCVVEHNMDAILSVADEAVFMDQGRIVARGTPRELIGRPELAEIYFGTR